MKKIYLTLIVLILFVLSGCNANSSKDNSNIYANVDLNNPESVYSAAQELYNKKEIIDAKSMFNNIPDYKDSENYIKKIDCITELLGNYTLWGDNDIEVYVTQKYLGIIGENNKYYTDYDVVEFRTNYAGSDDLCIFYPEFSSTTGGGVLLIKDSKNISLWTVKGYDDTLKEYILDGFKWLIPENE